MNKKKVLSLILCCFMVLSVGCSSADSKVSEENSQVENQVEAINNETLIATQYMDYSKYLFENIYVLDDINETVSSKYIDESLTKNIDFNQDFGRDILDLVDRGYRLVEKRQENGVKKGDIEKSTEFQDFIESFNYLNRTYKIGYNTNFLEVARQNSLNNPSSEKPMVEFANVKMKEDSDGYYTFIGEIINNNPSETFSGFGDVILYKDGQVVSKEPIVISEIAPDSKGVFETLPINVDFDNYEMKITTPNWN